jgi:hypothetical protein
LEKGEEIVMLRKLMVISFCMMLLTSCSTTVSTTPDRIDSAKEKIEKIFEMEITIPKPKGMFISSIQISYPPKLFNGKPNGNFHTVNVGYSFDRGTLREVTEEEIEWRKKRQQPEILYGPYKAEKGVISLMINNATHTDNKDTVLVSNTPVRYEEIKRDDRTMLMAQIFPKEGSYRVTCHYLHGLTEKGCHEFVQTLVKDLESK